MPWRLVLEKIDAQWMDEVCAEQSYEFIHHALEKCSQADPFEEGVRYIGVYQYYGPETACMVRFYLHWHETLPATLKFSVEESIIGA